MKKKYHHLANGTFRNPEGSKVIDMNFNWSFKVFNQEKKKLNISLRGAAIRFLLTRLLDFYKEEKNFLKKDPLDFLNILSFHIRNDLKC